MFSIFTKTTKPFKPVLSPLVPRKPCNSTYDEQRQSSFFTKLPPEIRNEIYSYTFTTEARESLSLEPHPLSLLLTCRKAYYEASILAFSHYAFSISANLNLTTFVPMRNAIAHLSPHQTYAITALSHSLRLKYTEAYSVTGTASIIANAILLFPNLKIFEIYLLRGKKEALEIHYSSVIGGHAYYNAHEKAIQQYAPHWFHTLLLQRITQGHAYAWQSGEHWKVEWPQLTDDKYFDVLDDCASHLTPKMSLDAVDKVRGVHLCPCPCGKAIWTSADIVQETGRRVAIDAIYYGAEYKPLSQLHKNVLLKVKRGPKAVILQEGVPPSNVVAGMSGGSSSEIRSFVYDADEQYWDAMRRRNGNWGAICRGVWNSLTSATSEEGFLGSMSLNEGDWARMREHAETFEAGDVGGIGDALDPEDISDATKYVESHVRRIS